MSALFLCVIVFYVEFISYSQHNILQLCVNMSLCLSVPVQSIAWRDSPPKWPIMCWVWLCCQSVDLSHTVMWLYASGSFTDSSIFQSVQTMW